MPSVPARASVVVVGGGVIGTSIAFHLAEAGVEGVVLVEREQLGEGSTSKAAGGVRAQFSDELNVRLGARSLEAFADFAKRPGGEIDLHRVGYLFVLTNEADVATFERNVAMQNAVGVPSRMIDATEAKALCPLLRTDDVLAAAFSPDDGHATPDAVVQGYAGGARAHGATVITRCSVEEIGRGRVTTTKGVIATDAVVCAAGPWSKAVGAMAGVHLPVEPMERRIRFTGPVDGMTETLPMTIDFATGFYFHREGPGLLMGIATESEDVETALADAAEQRAPEIARAALRGGWTGLYEMSPDHNALIGEAESENRFLYATGFSGHGFLQAPAVGEVVRDLFLGREPFVDVSPLGVERFGTLDERPEQVVV